MREEVNSLLGRFGGGSLFPFNSLSGPIWHAQFTFRSPTVDLTEDDSEFTLTAELAGMAENDFELSISGDQLLLEGEKKEDREQKTKNYHLSERSYGAFRRSFCIPQNVDRARISAFYENGVLKVTLPKSAEARKYDKKIEIKAL
jgi:HSP20 family protein